MGVLLYMLRGFLVVLISAEYSYVVNSAYFVAHVFVFKDVVSLWFWELLSRLVGNFDFAACPLGHLRLKGLLEPIALVEVMVSPQTIVVAQSGHLFVLERGSTGARILPDWRLDCPLEARRAAGDVFVRDAAMLLVEVNIDHLAAGVISLLPRSSAPID